MRIYDELNKQKAHLYALKTGRWGERDSNPRSIAQLVYSQPPLATWVSPPGADGGTRTRNRLFTKQLLCLLSYVGERSSTE